MKALAASHPWDLLDGSSSPVSSFNAKPKRAVSFEDLLVYDEWIRRLGLFCIERLRRQFFVESGRIYPSSAAETLAWRIRNLFSSAKQNLNYQRFQSEVEDCMNRDYPSGATPEMVRIKRQVMATIDSFGEPYSSLVYHYFFHQRSLAEMAKLWKCSKSAVAQHLEKAMEKLDQSCEEIFGGDKIRNMVLLSQLSGD